MLASIGKGHYDAALGTGTHGSCLFIMIRLYVPFLLSFVLAMGTVWPHDSIAC
jgi:hypothetical protein